MDIISGSIWANIELKLAVKMVKQTKKNHLLKLPYIFIGTKNFFNKCNQAYYEIQWEQTFLVD
jgi:hypothetical protein